MLNNIVTAHLVPIVFILDFAFFEAAASIQHAFPTGQRTWRSLHQLSGISQELIDLGACCLGFQKRSLIFSLQNRLIEITPFGGNVASRNTFHDKLTPGRSAALNLPRVPGIAPNKLTYHARISATAGVAK